MDKIYIQEAKFVINTANLYQCIKQNGNNIPEELINSFRDNVYESLVNNLNIVPELKFSKATAQDCKRKYEEYCNGFQSLNPFFPGFFVKPAKVNKNEFSDAERKVFESSRPFLLKSTTKQESDIKHNNGEESIFNWWYYNHDIYSYDQENVLIHDLNNHEYQYFLAWYIGLIDPYVFQHSIKGQIIQTFNFDNRQWVEYVNMLAVKFNKLTFLDNWTIIMKNLESKEISNSQKVGGRPPKDFRVSKPITRSNTDKLTSLNNLQTSLLFNYLKSEKIILNSSEILSDTDLSKLISCLTGYNQEELRKNLGSSEIKIDNKIKIKRVLQNIIALIDKELT